MSVLLVAGTVTLVVLIVQRLGGATEGLTLPPVSLGQPAGTRILSVTAAAEGRLAILVVRPDGERVLLVDPRRGRVAGEIRAAD
ncbi:MAG TPA: DUF6476 family protein [Acetobacteraceae bacterium]|jgi:hypothetical protein|nr:DUF6476 family protein [Acetobacteraceae bacterium]